MLPAEKDQRTVSTEYFICVMKFTNTIEKRMICIEIHRWILYEMHVESCVLSDRIYCAKDIVTKVLKISYQIGNQVENQKEGAQFIKCVQFQWFVKHKNWQLANYSNRSLSNQMIVCEFGLTSFDTQQGLISP